MEKLSEFCVIIESETDRIRLLEVLGDNDQVLDPNSHIFNEYDTRLYFGYDSKSKEWKVLSYSRICSEVDTRYVITVHKLSDMFTEPIQNEISEVKTDNSPPLASLLTSFPCDSEQERHLHKQIQHCSIKTDNSQTLENLKQAAEALGYELVEKKREIKVGDFGVFHDYENGYETRVFHGFFNKKLGHWYVAKHGLNATNFRHLTEEEKQHIQNNW